MPHEHGVIKYPPVRMVVETMANKMDVEMRMPAMFLIESKLPRIDFDRET
jgi:hypothetical protein